MKHIISLSLKYIRRQKLRTLLTFLCVTLSVFILCSVGAYMGSALQTAWNQCASVGGSHEADISEWLARVDDKEEALDIIENHVVVSDYFVIMSEYASGVSNRSENNNKISYFEFSDGKNTQKIERILENSFKGNKELVGSSYYTNENQYGSSGVVVPAWFEKMGYTVGDTVTFTLKPVTCEIDEDSEIVKEIRQKLLDEFGTSVVNDDPEYQELDYEIRRNAYKGSLKDAFYYYNMDFNELSVKNEEYGEPAEFSFKIGGFYDDYSYKGNSLNIGRTDTDNYFFDEFFEKNPEIANDKNINAYIRINDNINFDDGLIMLYGALGYKKGNYYSDLPSLNTSLLFYEFRSVGAVVEMLPLLIIFFIIVFFAWLVARFVIDNAFEISSQERSSQYATLRIMGASKVQITALVFTEALFYTLTAVPIGTITAYLLCSSLFTKFRNLGFEYFEFKANPYFIIGGIILCISAIFISAYTSAMWASRKLSPAEVLNFGKPKKKNKKVRRRKSKINLNSKQFIRRYINKNIMRNKSRYIISTLTMTLGVMFFTFALMLGISFYSSIEEDLTSDGKDFSIYFNSFDNDTFNNIEDTFYNEELFSNTKIYSASSYPLEENSRELLEDISIRGENIQEYCTVFAVDRHCFDENFAEYIGMTYDEFLQTEGAIFHESAYTYNYGENANVQEYEESYNLFETPETIQLRFQNAEIKVISSMCSTIDGIGTWLIVPIESEYVNILSLSMQVDTKVNGQENYAEAKKIFDEFAERPDIWFCQNNYMTNTGMSEFISAIVRTAGSFIISIWAVGILSMVNSINTSVLNRSRELMMLRSVGMSRKQLRKTIVLEGIMFSSVSSSVGIILALVAYFVVMTAVGFEPVMLVSMAVGLVASIAVNIFIAVVSAIPGIHNLESAESLVKSF